MATIRVKNPNLGGEKWITIPTKILSEADHIVTNKGQGDLYLSNDGTYKNVIKSANDYTDKLIELITGSSPDILETLKELSNQTSNNKDFINVLNKSIATKLDKTANAVSASKLATPIKLWGNDFDGSLSVYGNLCAPNGNLGLGINANNVVLGNNTNPSYIYGSSVMFKTGTDAVAAYISSDGKVGIGTANPLVGFHVNVNSYFDYPIKVSGTVDYSSPLLKLDATNTNNNGLLVLSKLGSSKAAIGVDDTNGMWFLNLSNSNIFRITSDSLTYGSNKIWHEGNDGPDSGLDADTLDGKHLTDILSIRTITSYSTLFDLNSLGDTNIDSTTWYYAGSPNVLNQPWDNSAATVWTFPGSYSMQIAKFYNSNEFKIRGRISDGWSAWKQIAFTDSDITGNAATASKLQTPVKLWGNDFDGSSDVNGTLNDVGFIYFNDQGGDLIYKANSEIAGFERGLSFKNADGTGSGYIGAYGEKGVLKYLFLGKNYTDSYLTVLPDGNVGIGTNNPLYKLDVAGIIRAKNIKIGAYLHNEFGGEYKFSSVYGGWDRGIIYRSSDSQLLTAIGAYGENDDLYYAYFGGAYNSPALVANKNKNIGIGTTTPQYKLDVADNVRIRGNAIINNATSYSSLDSNGDVLPLLVLTGGNNLLLGNTTASRGYNTYISGSNLIFRYGVTSTTGIILNSSGNVTIGGSDLATDKYKLHVLGKVYLNEYGAMGNKPGPYLHINKSGYPFAIGTSLSSDTISFGYATDDSWVNETITISNTGDCVGINNNNPKYALDVKGNVAFSGSLRAVSIYCTGIESGDYVDWYGVSWSEDSSDPTCTRIGNAALHRSLPILNAMKGYIFGKDDGTKNACIPLNDEWTAAKYAFHNHTLPQLEFYDRMIKIPEFWYIDDYEPSTKTHNLKISQTAKAGWCHHKEAYVGAYEGYSDGTHYRSQKGKIPTVSASRNTLRSLARANGYEDEYKWNIYTYEEHRAICHLFLVEYATRNSQAPVNTALTPDGFKQGGLGSGCTTGAVTINGQTTYSFIPTGTTDSLGNGSGQVAYTVTLTDADGNEIGTVTRYANRYRGIENPFGHIWKHVDDIVNVYNAETTYKTVYKCNKPEHFATNKNTKYKPLCSFPGGSKMQGWSKEIKATINCDFFKYSVGGSESTYWCNYNYDNDDTSEHCLLIGGRLGAGGRAGLFCFALSNGVGCSTVDVGSRLTYLPWAE